MRAAQSAGYLIYSEADFDVFRPVEATRCIDGVTFGTEDGTSVPNFTPIGASHPIGASIRVYRTTKTEIFTDI